MGVFGVYTVLGETTRNPTNTMVKPLDSNRAVAVVARCRSCLVSRLLCSTVLFHDTLQILQNSIVIVSESESARYSKHL